jgi:hypothetical protein
MVKFLVILFILSVSSVSGQALLPLQHDTIIIKHEFIFSANGDLGSSAIPKSIFGPFLFGGGISTETKDKALSKHKANNRIGATAHAEFEYRNYNVNLFKNPKYGFLVHGGYYLVASGNYSKDLFEMAFYGNESFLGRTADFSSSNMRFTSFQKIGFGIIDKKHKSSLSINFVNVSSFADASIYKGEMKQDSEGENIAVLMEGNFSQTQGSSFSKGMGASIDFDYRIPFMLNKNRVAFVQVQVKNFGFAYMHKGVKSYQVDSTYAYSGFNLNQLVNNSNTFSSDFSLEDSLNIRPENKKQFVSLPFYVQIGKIVDENYTGKWQSFFGLRIYPTASYVPMLFVGGNWKPKEWLNIGFSASYGGYTKLRGGLYASFKLDKIHLGIGTEDVYGLISKNALGESLNIRMRWSI